MENSYIAQLVKPVTNKSSSRKVWSVDLETVWLPFFTATNAMGNTAIKHEALGCPLRLGYNKDGSVKFRIDGKPVIQVAKDIASNVRLVRENFVAGLQSFAHEVFTNHADLYKAEVAKNIEAGKPVSAYDANKLTLALAEIAKQAKAEADKQAKTEADRAVVEQALAHAEAETPTEANTDKSKGKVKVKA